MPSAANMTSPSRVLGSTTINSIIPRRFSATVRYDDDIDLETHSSLLRPGGGHGHSRPLLSDVGFGPGPSSSSSSAAGNPLRSSSSAATTPVTPYSYTSSTVFEDDEPESPRDYNDRRSLDSSAPLQGVRRVEAIQAVWTRKSRWVLFIGLALASYVYSLDGSTTWQFLFYATSTVFGNSYSGSITTAAAIIIAVGKPLMAKLADVFGRAESYVAVATLYSLGYGIIASSQSIKGLAGGTLVYSFGYTGLQLLSQIVIADMTTLRWRGLSSALLSFPFIINNFVAAEIAEGILPDWRYGYTLFACAVPLCLSLIVGTMFWAQRRAKKINDEKNFHDAVFMAPAEETWMKGMVNTMKEMDVLGLVLITTSLSLVLLPLTLANTADKGWQNPVMPGLVISGLLLFPIFCWYECTCPENPIIPYKFLRNRSILGACLIGFFDFVSFYLQFTNLYNFIYVTQDWSPRNLSYFASIQTMAMTIFGIIGGAIMSRTREVKNLLFVGLMIRLAGVALMIHSRGANGTPLELVLNQALQGIGGGFAVVTLQVSAQAGVPHADVATVTAMVMLITEVGNSVGSAIATSIYTRKMPKAIARHVFTNNATLKADLYLSPTIARQFPHTDPIRRGIIMAYDDIMFRQLVVATAVAMLPPIICYYLTKQDRLEDVQNLADRRDLAGNRTDESEDGLSGVYSALDVRPRG